MAVFGKALGNGYAVTAVIGRREIMESVQSTFISSTFWTEKIGSVAALKTLEVMEKENSWEMISRIGADISKRWTSLGEKYHLPLTLYGIPAISSFGFKSANNLSYKTLITQEMLRRGYLASNLIYVSTEHTAEIVDGYFENIEPIFATIKDCEEGLDISSLLDTPVCHSGFKRLN
jgi:glutamate-1-semialdehyde 2,1-aminomutase